MGYAIRKDGQGWRSVESKSDCTSDEVFSADQPEMILTNHRLTEIDARLTQIDLESIRPTRALRLYPESELDLNKLEQLEAEAELLRDERRDLAA